MPLRANGSHGGDDAFFGELVGGPGKHPLTFGQGRTCEEEGCSTRLSIYNSRSRCSVHDFDSSLMNFRCPAHLPGTSVPAPRRTRGSAGAGRSDRPLRTARTARKAAPGREAA